MKKKKHRQNKGFTLIELLVVVAIISMLASIVLVSLSGAREKARIGKAKAEVRNIWTASEILFNDTGKYPGGCPNGVGTDETITLDSPEAGLVQRPNPVTFSSTCFWAANDISKWNGPYLGANNLIDPWGHPYRIDYDYFGYSGYPGTGPGCPSLYKDGAVFLSTGPNGTSYDCDDISNYLWTPINIAF